MSLPNHAVGQVIFIRTDSFDYEEIPVAFQTLEELVRICSEPRGGMSLERVVVFQIQNGQPVAVTLGFISASKGLRQEAWPPEFRTQG